MNPRIPHQKTAAMTLVEVLVVIAALVVLAAVLLRPTSQRYPAMRTECMMNLKTVGLAFLGWGDDHNGKFPMQVSVANGGTMELNDGSNALAALLVMSNKLPTPKVFWCPVDKDHVLPTNNWTSGFSAKNVSYFVGLDADKGHPQMFLSGDDNFTVGGIPVKSGLLEFSTKTPITWADSRHEECGNIGLADGSVKMVSLQSLPQVIQNTGVATNRLAIP